MKRIRRSLAAKVLVGGLALLLVVITTVSATFLINRDRDALAAASAMADNRATVAAQLLPQTTGVQSADALERIGGDPALTEIMGPNPPQSAWAALDADAAMASAATAIVIVDGNGSFVFGHIPAAWSGGAASWGQMPSIRAAINGRQVNGVDVVAKIPVHAVAMPLRRGGQTVGAAAAITPVSSLIQQFASTTGYPAVYISSAAPGRMLRATATTVSDTVLPAGLAASIADGGAVARVTEGSGARPDDRTISVVPIPGIVGATPAAYLGTEVRLQQFTGDARSQNENVISVGLIAVFAILVTTLALIWFVNVVVRRPLSRLERAVARISAGDYSANIPIASSDELGRLAASVNRMRGKIADTVHTMEIQANTDPHTGLFNFRFLIEHLRREAASAARHDTPLSVLMLDIDHFKSVNDRYGHPGGDCALAAVATTIANSIRTADVAARYGGEEFAIVMPHTDHVQALVVAEKIRTAISAQPIDLSDGISCRLTVSIGAASYPEHCVTPNTLIELADGALYEAKEGGRNRVCAARPLPAPGRGSKPRVGRSAPHLGIEPVPEHLAKA
ncbi:MAG: diguanylate cyclase [Chloroflexota bacterium]|jgi:diguanylate cyclase (GGDEF)-like protein|nr:diguanylate cyclase [Chloroflexota bacterium]